jgi:hypothetical protein
VTGDAMDPDDGLQQVGRRARPMVWFGAWGVVLGAVILVAVVGASRSSPPVPSGPPVAIAASASPSSSPAPAPVPRREPRAFPTRPPLGEDGLIGGLVFGTNWPPGGTTGSSGETPASAPEASATPDPSSP